MPSFVHIRLGRPFSVFTRNGRLILEGERDIYIPFDDDSAHHARQEIVMLALGGLPPGFAHVATHVVPGEVVTEDGTQERLQPGREVQGQAACEGPRVRASVERRVSAAADA